MARGNPHYLAEITARQAQTKRAYKNSECDHCGCYLCKVHPRTINGQTVIVCDDCRERMTS